MSIAISRPQATILMRRVSPSYLLLVGFALALLLRMHVGGIGIRTSALAGVCFAACLCALTLTAGTTTKLTRRSYLWGFWGAACLCAPAALLFLYRQGVSPSLHGYASWAIVVSLVALAEEAFLRGALFDMLARTHGNAVTIAVCAAAFALLHLPLYGWHALPLDYIVGVWFGVLRVVSGSWVAPGIAHTLTDLASWWLR